MAGPSAAICVTRVFLGFLASSSIAQYFSGAGAIEWGFGIPGAAKPAFLDSAEGSPSTISPPGEGQTASIDLPQASEAWESLPFESPVADVGTRNLDNRRHSWSSLRPARPHEPIRRYSLPPRPSTKFESVKDTSRGPQSASQQPPPQKPSERKGFFRRAFGKARHWSSKARTKLGKLWAAFTRRLRKAKEAAKHAAARIYAKLPKWRRRRAQAPEPFQHALRAPSAGEPTWTLPFEGGLGPSFGRRASERLLRRPYVVKTPARRASEPALLPERFQKLEGKLQGAEVSELREKKPVPAPSAAATLRLATPPALTRPSTSSAKSTSGWSEAVTASEPPSPTEDRRDEEQDLFYDALEVQPQETPKALEGILQAGSVPPVPEAEERARGAETSTAAPQEEEEEGFEVVPSKEKSRDAAETEEEYADVLSPEEMSALLKSPEGCETWVRQLTPMLKVAWQNCPSFCAIWTLFNRDGRLSTSKDDMMMLAAQLSSKVNAARVLDPERQDLDAQLLRMQLSLAEVQENLIKARSSTERECWFTEPNGVYAHADAAEIDVLNSAASNPATAMRPKSVLKKLSRLMNLAEAHIPSCILAADAEREARSAVQAALRTQKERIEHILEGYENKTSPTDILRAKRLARDLQSLEQREACSIEILYLLEDQVSEIKNFLITYKANGESWWTHQLFLRLRRCLRKHRNSQVVPSAIADGCRQYEGSLHPVFADGASPDTLWFWEAADERLETPE